MRPRIGRSAITGRSPAVPTAPRSADADSWSQLMRRLETEWAMLTAAAEAMGAAFTDEEMGADLR